MIQEHAPLFTADAVLPSGTISKVSLSQYLSPPAPLAAQWVLLFFYPLDFTFVCPTEILAFAERAPEFAALNCQLLAISCDNVHTHAAWCNTPRSEGGIAHLQIPLLSDFNKTISQAYGVLTEDRVSLRASFLISPDGMVRHITINDLPVGRNVDEALRVLQAFQFVEQHGEVCPANWQPGERGMKASREGASAYLGGGDRYRESESSDNVTTVNFRRLVAAQSLTPPSQNIFSSLLQSYNLSIQRSPLLTKSLTSCVIAVCGELVGSYLRSCSTSGATGTAQRALAATRGQELLERIRRVCVFAVYGLCVTGPFFHWWYGFLERTVQSWRLSPSLSVVVKIALDRLVATPPFLLFTLAYLQFFFTLDRQKTVQAIKNTFAVSLLTNWKVWTPIQAVNFQYVPLQYRVLFGNIAALWWNIYLSLATSK